MKNKVIIAAAVLLFSSCGVFRNQDKTNKKSSSDSTSSVKSSSNLVDTTKFKNYSRATFYFAPGTSNPDIASSLQDFGSSLLSNATSGLANAIRGLQDSTSKSGFVGTKKKASNQSPNLGPPMNFPGLLAAQFESFNQQDNGVKLSGTFEQGIEVKKDEHLKTNTKTVSLKALSVVGGIIVLINLIISFLLYRFVKSKI